MVRVIAASAPSSAVTHFVAIGDWMRSSKSDLEKAINCGIKVCLYDGDADYIVNYQGFEDMIDSLDHKYSVEYASTNWTTWTVEGVVTGQFKNAGTFSYVRVKGFVLRLHASRFKLTSLLPGLATRSLPIPSVTSHTDCTPRPCSARWQLACQSPRHSQSS